MPGLSRSVTFKLSLSLSISLLLAASNSLCLSSQAKNRAVEYMKYFSPLPQKNYLNESQDRLIKKQGFKTSELPKTIPSKNSELGFFAVIPANKLTDNDYIESLLSNPKTAGLSALIPWKSIEPQEEKYNWNLIDNLLSYCQKHDKNLILRISTCGVDIANTDTKSTELLSDTPEWVFAQGTKQIKYFDKNGQAHLMPVFWDQTYLASFSNFINELGSRYNKNTLIHSIGITGGGFRGGTTILPSTMEKQGGEKTDDATSGFHSTQQIEAYLKNKEGLSQKQIVDHWKYVADLFPQAFPDTRLNFAINPPTPNRAGEDALDEISDYLLYRYGQHIYITRQDKSDGKHGFDDYRVLLKFRPDTYTGIALLPSLNPEDLNKLSKSLLDDGVSFIEMPKELLESKDPGVQQALETLHSHLGYQLVLQSAQIPKDLSKGQTLKVEFSFMNVGNTAPKRPVRELDKDVPTSYKVLIELKNSDGKSVAKILHTPEKKTETWISGQSFSWQQNLRMPDLAPGEYTAFLSLYDPIAEKSLQILDSRAKDKQFNLNSVDIGKLKITNDSTASSNTKAITN